jgi:hypothetical protein
MELDFYGNPHQLSQQDCYGYRPTNYNCPTAVNAQSNNQNNYENKGYYID